jgi:chemotaxis protein methyltransferase CheR
VVFAPHNLATDTSFNEFHLILCRNVLIYFDTQLQHRVYNLFTDSLVRLGVLGLGPKESLRFSPVEHRYDPIDADLRVWKLAR